jgi:hypothetical protein
MPERASQSEDFGSDVPQEHAFAFGEGVSGVTIRAAQVAGRQSHENAGQAREGALTLQAQVNLIDLKQIRHLALNLTGKRPD